MQDCGAAFGGCPVAFPMGAEVGGGPFVFWNVVHAEDEGVEEACAGFHFAVSGYFGGPGSQGPSGIRRAAAPDVELGVQEEDVPVWEPEVHVNFDFSGAVRHPHHQVGVLKVAEFHVCFRIYLVEFQWKFVVLDVVHGVAIYRSVRDISGVLSFWATSKAQGQAKDILLQGHLVEAHSVGAFFVFVAHRL